jgi:hypothetical protein
MTLPSDLLSIFKAAIPEVLCFSHNNLINVWYQACPPLATPLLSFQKGIFRKAFPRKDRDDGQGSGMGLPDVR